MATIALQGPDFARTSRCGIQHFRNNLQGIASFEIISKSTPAWKELSKKLNKVSTSGIHKFSPSDIKYDMVQQNYQASIIGGEKTEFVEFVVREAKLDEEYWTAAWLRAETHFEDHENDRYADNFKRKFAEQEYNLLKKRCNVQLGEQCTCIVTVKKEDRLMKSTILKSVVGTLDLSIRYLSQGENYPGEQVKAPLFCLIERKSSSRYGYIANLCVAKSARRQSIAENMLEFSIKAAKDNGAERVFVHVSRHNKPAQCLYRKLRFEVVDAASSQLSIDQTFLLCLSN